MKIFRNETQLYNTEYISSMNLASKLLDSSVGLMPEDPREFFVFLTKEEVDLFWKNQIVYSQLFTPKREYENAERNPKEAKYPVKLVGVNGIQITLDLI